MSPLSIQVHTRYQIVRRVRSIFMQQCNHWWTVDEFVYLFISSVLSFSLYCVIYRCLRHINKKVIVEKNSTNTPIFVDLDIYGILNADERNYIAWSISSVKDRMWIWQNNRLQTSYESLNALYGWYWHSVLIDCQNDQWSKGWHCREGCACYSFFAFLFSVLSSFATTTTIIHRRSNIFFHTCFHRCTIIICVHVLICIIYMHDIIIIIASSAVIEF